MISWLSKHGTPVARDGAFHWYPADGDRELRARIVERMRGIEPPAVLFELAPDRVAWALVFAAISPSDQRHYTGLALAVAATLETLEVPVAAPMAGIATDDEPVGDLGAIAAALLGDGAIRVANPTAAGLPRAVASVLAVLPRAVRARTIVGSIRHGVAPAVTGLAAAIARAPGSLACSLYRELADARGADRVRPAGDALTADERAVVGAGDPIATLHAWGRGRLDASATAATLPARLADALAEQIVDVALAGGDPAAPIRDARWTALLPAARRTELLAALAARGDVLRTLVEDHHA